ncbi:hypothetical protein [Pedococcus sp. P5_B7]
MVGHDFFATAIGVMTFAYLVFAFEARRSEGRVRRGLWAALADDRGPERAWGYVALSFLVLTFPAIVVGLLALAVDEPSTWMAWFVGSETSVIVLLATLATVGALLPEDKV